MKKNKILFEKININVKFEWPNRNNRREKTKINWRNVKKIIYLSKDVNRKESEIEIIKTKIKEYKF
jgi:hypothetical protein